jgi:hypothetical protein
VRKDRKIGRKGSLVILTCSLTLNILAKNVVPLLAVPVEKIAFVMLDIH